jgi:DNA-directed RNA polymerase specialized sigma24 family protein
MEEKALSLISDKLDAIIRLMVTYLSENKGQSERIQLFSLAGFTPKEISSFVGTTPNTVRVTLSKLRKHVRN